MSQKQPKNYHSIVMQVTIAAMVVGVFGWISVWDSYSLKVIPLQAKYTLGMANDQDLKELSQICYERKRYDCSSNTLRSLVTVYNSKESSLYEQLADSYIKTNRPKQAISAIESLEKIKTVSSDLLEQKAQLQMKNGQEQKALETLNKANSVAKGTDRISVAREQIALLIKMNLFTEAYSKIMEIRKSSTLANLFMEKELRMITKHLEVAQLKLPSRNPASYRR